MLSIQFTPFPVLHTTRLVLRQLTAEDAVAIQFFRSDTGFLRYIPRTPEPTLAQAQQHIQVLDELLSRNEAITWGLSLPGQPALLGTICLWNLQPAHYRAEIGYGLHPTSSRQELMGEALGAVVQFGFETLKLHSIAAQLDPEETVPKTAATALFNKGKIGSKDTNNGLLMLMLLVLDPAPREV